jgi:hypothetical protein
MAVKWNIYRISLDYLPTTEYQLVASVSVGTATYTDETDNDDLGIAQRHMLRAQGNRPQTRAADLIQTPGAGFFRQAGADGGLTGRVLTLTRGQYLTQNGFFYFGLVDPGTGHDAFNHRSTQIMGRSARERAVEAANGGPPRCNDYHIGHELSPPFAQRRDAALQHG